MAADERRSARICVHPRPHTKTLVPGAPNYFFLHFPFSGLQRPHDLHIRSPTYSNSAFLLGYCFKVSQQYVSFPAFPRDRVSRQHPARLQNRKAGTTFEIRPPGMKEETK